VHAIGVDRLSLMSDTVECAVCGAPVEVDLVFVVTQTQEPIYGAAPGRGAIHEDGRVVHQCADGQY
jgi:hypothetical protein